MSDKIKTIDEKIREKALEELRTEVKDAFKGAYAAYRQHHGYIATELRNKGGNYHSVDEVLNIARDAIIEAMREGRQNKAVDAFMDKVEHLGEELQDLRNQIDN